MRLTAPILALGGAGLLGVAWALGKGSGARLEAAVSLQTVLAQDTRIPYRARRWAQAVAQAASSTVPPGVPLETWGRVLLGKLDRESLGGDALRPRDASGTGDWTARTADRLPAALAGQARIIDAASPFPAGWSPPRDKSGNIKPGPYFIPGDGLGFGRGLSQIDWTSHAFARTGDWSNPTENIRYGARYLADLYRALASWSGRGTVDPMRLALAAYNAGQTAVKSAVLAGRSPDVVTTGSDYGADVLRRAGVA